MATKEYKEKFLYLGSNGQGPDYLFYGAHALLDTSSYKSNFDALSDFRKKHPYVAGYLSYELKNELETLHSANVSYIPTDRIWFFSPKAVLKRKDNLVTTLFSINSESRDEAALFMKALGDRPAELRVNKPDVHFEEKSDYIKRIKSLKQHIQLGDIYEANLCQEIKLCNLELSPLDYYNSLNALTLAPYSCLLNMGDKHLISASPELFLKKEGSEVLSKPIKGTRKRDKNPLNDKALAEELANDLKERAENIMITDLVRNDMSKTAEAASVKVRELCKVYSFETVHQMISTVVSQVGPDVDPVDIIKSCFPMGSMTGAPKVSAMELIDKHEEFQRGLYSGAVGYFSPDDDFQFNVVIRSFLYDHVSKKGSIGAGGAITSKSDPELEYEESMLKAKALLDILLTNKS